MFTPCRLATTLLFLWLLLTGAPCPAQQYQETASVAEEEIKAVYLYNFLHFVRWPEDSPAGPKKIVVIGDAPFADALRQIERKLQGQPEKAISVTFYGAFPEGARLKHCHLLYLGLSATKDLPRILAALGNAPVLTVADGEEFMNSGGIIALVRQDNRLRWSINRRSGARAGLRFSAKLLDIAINVIEDNESFRHGECRDHFVGVPARQGGCPPADGAVKNG